MFSAIRDERGRARESHIGALRIMWQVLALSMSWTLSGGGVRPAQVVPALSSGPTFRSRADGSSVVMRKKAFGVRHYNKRRVVAATDVGKVVPTATAMSFADELAADTARAISQANIECSRHQDVVVEDVVSVFKVCCKTAAKGGWTFAEWSGKLSSTGPAAYGADFRAELERKVEAHHLALRDLAALEEKLGAAIAALGVQNPRVTVAKRVSDVDVYISAEWPVRPRLPAAGGTAVPMVSVVIG